MKVKINNRVANARPDESGDRVIDDMMVLWEEEKDRCIEDLLFIQKNKKMYINEKKQLQNLIMNLYEIGYYAKEETALDEIGLV